MLQKISIRKRSQPLPSLEALAVAVSGGRKLVRHHSDISLIRTPVQFQDSLPQCSGTCLVTSFPSQRVNTDSKTVKGWDCCHEISASNGEGIEEVFRVITRKLVEQKNKKEQEQSQERNSTLGQKRGQSGYFEGLSDIQGSFKLTNKRQSWLGIASTPGTANGEETNDGAQSLVRNRNGKCC